MFFLRPPSDPAIHEILHGLREAAFTYAEVGCTRESLEAAPPGFLLDRYGVELGSGRDLFERARDHLSRLENYPPSFTRVVWVPGGLAEGALFATVARHLGFVSVHPCRVIYLIEEPDRFGLGFGTLPGHAESGEERFVIEIEGGRVRYEVQAFSRPKGLLPRLGAPVTRAYQRRFQRETLQRMRALARG